MNAVGIGILYLVLGNMVAVFSDAPGQSAGSGQPLFQFFLLPPALSAAPAARPGCSGQLWRRNPPVAPWHLRGPHLGHRRLPDGGRPHPSCRSPPPTPSSMAPLLDGAARGLAGGEALSRQKVLTALFGFVGVLIVLRPTEVNWAALGPWGWRSPGGQQSADQADPCSSSPSPRPCSSPMCWHALHPGAGLVGRGDWQWQMWWPAFGSSALIMVYAGLCVMAIARRRRQDRLGGVHQAADGSRHRVWLFDEQPGLLLLLGCLCIILPLVAMARSKAQAAGRAGAPACRVKQGRPSAADGGSRPVRNQGSS